MQSVLGRQDMCGAIIIMGTKELKLGVKWGK